MCFKKRVLDTLTLQAKYLTLVRRLKNLQTTNSTHRTDAFTISYNGILQEHEIKKANLSSEWSVKGKTYK